MLQHTHILERVLFHRDDVGPMAGLDAACFRAPAHQVRGVHGCGLQGCERRHAHLVDIHIELMGVQPVRIHRGIGAQCYLHPGLDRVLHVLFGHHNRIRHFLLVERRQVSFFGKPVFEVESGHQVGSVLLHRGDGFIVDIAAMFDRVDAGLGCPRMPWAPWAWAATLRPSRWASATMARISSMVYCEAWVSSPFDKTPRWRRS